MEGHMAHCDDCRESLVLFARISGEEFDHVEASDLSGSDELIHRQTAKVLALIARDEANQLTAGARQARVRPERSGFFASYAQLGFAATLIIVAAVTINYLTMGSRAEQAEGMQAHASAIRENRRINPRISGGFEYSPNPVTRGERKNDELQFDIALNKLKFAEEESAPAEARMILARVYLSRDNPGDADLAMKILQDVKNRTEATPELLNDIGVAFFQNEEMPDAIKAFSEALEKKPDYQEALFNRALAHAHAANYYAARKDFEQFIEISTSEKWKQEARERLSKL
ncbi:MAG TPA: tetratricopeptide repeat protein [Blastocatellia bacterium]|jgi:tetratricopeptide (TPR) repeat protein|nr:tetratricopeptide repeat protein [Blastocatellia bacterium]